MDSTRKKWIIGVLTSIGTALVVWWLTNSILVREEYAVEIERHDWGVGREAEVVLFVENVGQKPLQEFVTRLTVLTSQKLDYRAPQDCKLTSRKRVANSTFQELAFACSLLNPDERVSFAVKFVPQSDPCATLETQVNVMIKATGYTGSEVTREDERRCGR